MLSPVEIGRRIAAERSRLGLTQAEVATRLGVATQSYSQMEYGGNPRANTLIELANVGFDLGRMLPELFLGRTGR